MNFAFFIRSAIVAPVHSLLNWLASAASPASSVALPALSGQGIAHKSIAPNAIRTRDISRVAALQKPLRVVRVVEAGQSRTSVGRMVISGRMADVCAELDRLAAREAAPS